MPKRTRLNSSFIDWVLYDATSGHLKVRFHDGHKSEFRNVAETTVSELIKAPSPGRYYIYHFKNVYLHRMRKRKNWHTALSKMLRHTTTVAARAGHYAIIFGIALVTWASILHTPGGVAAMPSIDPAKTASIK